MRTYAVIVFLFKSRNEESRCHNQASSWVDDRLTPDKALLVLNLARIEEQRGLVCLSLRRQP